MKEVSIKKIKDGAKKLVEERKSWHFHILTPECQFNESDKSAFILEDTSDGEVFVFYSDKPQMEVGKELVRMLHGKDVVGNADQNTDEDEQRELTEIVSEILKRAKELNEQKQFWHHHMLFPDCTFNDQKGKWMIVFEDQEKGELLKAVFNNEPKAELKEIETLFYSQKK